MTGSRHWLDLHPTVAIELVGTTVELRSRLADRLGLRVRTGAPARDPAMRIADVGAVRPVDAIVVGDLLVDRGGVIARDADDQPVARLLLGTGMPLEVEVATSARDVPLFGELVNLCLLRAGVLPLHAASCILDGRGVACAGWSGGGKTDLLVSLVGAGAVPLADEWTMVGPAPGRMQGMRTPMRVSDRQLEQLRGYRPSARGRLRMRTMTAIDAIARGVARTRVPGVGRAAGRVARRARARRVAWIRLDVADAPSSLEHLLLVRRHPGTELTVRRIAAGDVVEPLLMAHEQHRAALHAVHRALRFGDDPGGGSIEETAALERDLLERLLAETTAWEVRLPIAGAGSDGVARIRDALAAG